MLAGGALGLVSAFLQTLQKIASLQSKGGVLPCDINDVFSCSTVLNAWQSSVFGFPNSVMCMVLFTIFASVALVGAGGGSVSRGVRLGIQGLSLFTLGFALWFLWQSTYSIGALCIYCLFCFAGLLAVNWAWLRINVADLPFERLRGVLQRWVASGIDVFIWLIIAVVVALAMVIQFGL
jgi:uncharacterized membrane protein